MASCHPAVGAIFQTRLLEAARATESALDRILSHVPAPGEAARPALLVEAMRYAALGGGKRIRPFLLIESARLFGAAGDRVVSAAAALECVHAYSLVHDDLPAMDDDDVRRGRPTLHKAFDEATAILAGDALLTIAFDVLAGIDAPAETRAALVVRLARAAGAGGMVGGQMLDLDQGRRWDEPGLRAMQGMKTGALFSYAAEAGAILAGAGLEDRDLMRRFGAHFGAAFQLADDIDDAAGDDAAGRPSLAALLGPDAARRMLEEEAEAAVALLAPFAGRGAALAEAARSLLAVPALSPDPPA
ncbi:MAG TPA: polyprenyl synthetase family protein [Bauldia sp.]|nr:polyprenyl synthetase family protein [Bauldia sp.]